MRAVGLASTYRADELRGAHLVISALPVVLSRPIDEGIELFLPHVAD
jgi:hypothetical protein